MKLTKRISLLVTVLLLCLSLASCGKISQKYADKVNEAAEEGNPLTYTEVCDDLGDSAIKLVEGEKLGLATGIVIAVKGCETLEEVQAKIDEGKTVKGIIITIAVNKAVSAKYTEITEEDLK